MTIPTQPHMRMEDEIPVPCDCMLGYHHTPEGEPLIERDDLTEEIIRTKGRHPHCIGLCKSWDSPTEEFDFRLTTGRRVSQRRVLTGVKITDYTLPRHHNVIVSWDNDPVSACAVLGILRYAIWRQMTAPEETA